MNIPKVIYQVTLTILRLSGINLNPSAYCTKISYRYCPFPSKTVFGPIHVFFLPSHHLELKNYYSMKYLHQNHKTLQFPIYLKANLVLKHVPIHFHFLSKFFYVIYKVIHFKHYLNLEILKHNYKSNIIKLNLNYKYFI